MSLSKTLLCALSVLCLSCPVSAVRAETDDEVEHGKINTADASPVDAGNYEIETSFSYAFSNRLWDNNGDSHKRGFTSEHAAEFAATAGIVDNLDVAIGGNYAWLRDKENDFDSDGTAGPITGNGIGDLNISARYRFLQNEQLGLEMAYIGGFSIPTGTESDDSKIGTSQEYWGFNQTLVASKDWGKWTTNADMGYALPFGDKRGDARGTFNADIAGGYQILAWLQPEVEVNYSHDFIAHNDDADVLAMTAGLVMPINEHLGVKAGIQQGLWGVNADKTTAGSLTLKFSF